METHYSACKIWASIYDLNLKEALLEKAGQLCRKRKEDFRISDAMRKNRGKEPL